MPETTGPETAGPETAGPESAGTSGKPEEAGSRRIRPPQIPSHRVGLEYAEVGGLGPVPLATIGGRVAARLIDGVIVGVFPVVGVVLLGDLFTGWVRVTVLLAVVSVLAVGYEVLLTAYRGATPGKRIAGIRVVRLDDGWTPGYGVAFTRGAILLAPGMVPLFGQLSQLCCVTSAIRDERSNRGWHDQAAGTVVVLDRVVLDG